MAEFFDILKQLVSKEFRVEFRSRGMIGTSVSFAVSSVVMTGIGFGGFIKDGKTAAVLFWIIALFSAMTPVSHLFLRDEEEGTETLMRLYFRSDAVFLAKTVCGAIFVLFSLGFMAPLFIGFFDVTVKAPCALAAVIISGGISAACSTAFAGALSSRVGGRGSLFAVLSVPAVLPVLAAAVDGTKAALTGSTGGWGDAAFCLAYGVVMAAVSVWLYDKIWLEE